ncbi:MAG: YtxH domain-containing protein [Candidatus Dojkabacteria bacterium]|jgi:gas vesicle protein
MRNNSDIDSFLKGLVLGVVGGAVAGILLAPKSGVETREDIKRLTLELKDKAVDLYEDARKEVQRKIALLKKAGSKIDESKYRSLISEVVEEFKQDAKVTSSVAKELAEQLKADWSNVKKELSS